jgi:hypothetical protein
MAFKKETIQNGLKARILLWIAILDKMNFRHDPMFTRAVSSHGLVAKAEDS